ncbi:MAG: hypothetical protein PVSMB3_05870 [Candidatus Dormibacteraceae bacterium]
MASALAPMRESPQVSLVATVAGEGEGTGSNTGVGVGVGAEVAMGAVVTDGSTDGDERLEVAGVVHPASRTAANKNRSFTSNTTADLPSVLRLVLQARVP